MKISRRRFASALSAGAFWAQATRDGRVSTQAARALLEAQGESGIFTEEEWLELLRQALEQSIEMREILRRYPIGDDVEPAMTFKRD